MSFHLPLEQEELEQAQKNLDDAEAALSESETAVQKYEEDLDVRLGTETAVDVIRQKALQAPTEGEGKEVQELRNLYTKKQQAEDTRAQAEAQKGKIVKEGMTVAGLLNRGQTVLEHCFKKELSSLESSVKRIAHHLADHLPDVWDVLGPRMEGHRSAVNGVRQLSDGRLVSWSADCSVKVWNLKSRKPVLSLMGHREPVVDVVELETGFEIASASHDTDIRVWCLQTGQCLATLKSHRKPVYFLAMVGDFLVSGSGEKSLNIKMWVSPYRGAYSYHLKGHEGSVRALIPLSSSRFASGSSDSTIRIWDTNGSSPPCVKILRRHTNMVTNLAVSSAKFLISASDDCTVRLWDTRDWTCLVLLSHLRSPVTSLTTMINGNLAMGLLDGSVHMWDCDSLTLETKKTNIHCKLSPRLASLKTSANVKVAKDKRVNDLAMANDCIFDIRIWRQQRHPLPKELLAVEHPEK